MVHVGYGNARPVPVLSLIGEGRRGRNVVCVVTIEDNSDLYLFESVSNGTFVAVKGVLKYAPVSPVLEPCQILATKPPR